MEQKQKLFVRSEAIVKLLLGGNEELDTLITCKGNTVNLMTTDQALYEALASIQEKEKISYPKLVKLLEVTQVTSHTEWKKEKRSIITPERAEEIRKRSENKGDTDE